jgi:hypothetical protein
MLVLTWLTIFVIACACLHQTLTRRLPAVLGAVFGVLLWAVLAFGALNLAVVDGGGVAFRSSSQVLSYLALGGIVVNFVFAAAAFLDKLPRGSPAERSDIV